MVRGTSGTILVTFAALHGDPYTRDKETGEFRRTDHNDPLDWGPTLRAATDPHSDLFRRVSDIYYFCHPAKQGPRRVKGRSARDVASETEAAIAEHLQPSDRPRFHMVTWETDRPPNDHAHLFDVVRRELPAIRAAHPKAEIVLQLSSGTSAMHAVLLLAGSVGIVEGPIRLLQAERSDGARKRPETPLVEVPFALNTILQIARNTIPSQPGTDQAVSLSFDQARSPALRKALTAAYRAARVRFPILLRGERGVGKSTIASLIRAASPFCDPKRNSSWPSIACGQIVDPDRLYAALCGHTAGAFTSAVKNSPGLLSQAHNDTLFLDEVHDLDPRSQRAIIRVIEEGTYYRLGENTPRKSSFRLITGTNLPDEALRKRLTADFLDRIRDIEIVLPALRDCREDLPWMWRETWSRVARDCGLAPSILDVETPRVVSGLSSHRLPGNWRDLRRIAVRIAVIAADGVRLSPNMIDQVLRELDGVDETFGSLPALVESGPRLKSGHDKGRLAKLEESLGPGLQNFWSLCAAGKGPKLALVELLGDRHRARSAAAFVARVFPDRWQSVSVK